MVKHLVGKFLLALALHSGFSGVPLKQSVPLMLSGQFDAYTTYHVLNNCPYEHCWEVNPILKPFASTPLIFPAIAAGDSFVLAGGHDLLPGHPRIRAAIIYGFVGLHVWCGLHNLKMASQGEQYGN